MAVVGIVAEYNPFHRGHLYHIDETRARRPDALLMACMSGNWVQRGDPAVTDKWQRARWAALEGVDLVFELPTVFALSSAETFARGAVALLAAAGADTLSFGCESDDLPRLNSLAAALSSPAFSAALSPLLGQGLSFPAARQKAAAQLLDGETAKLLEQPNNNLAVEYLRAMPDPMSPLPIRRMGAHDGPLVGDFPSASAIRGLLYDGAFQQARVYLPQSWSGEAARIEHGERALLAQLRRLSPEDWAAVPDSGDGLAQRLYDAARSETSFPALLERAKSRHLTLSRVRRVALWGFLGLNASHRPAAPQYLRVLAMTARGQAHLASLKGTCPLPVITKPAQFREELALESSLTDLYGLFFPTPLPCGGEFLHSPAVV